MNFYQIQLFEYALYCYNEFAERDSNVANKLSPIFLDDLGPFIGSSISFSNSSLSILYVKNFDTLEVNAHTTSKDPESSEPFFTIRRLVYNFLSKLSFGIDIFYLKPELLISVFENLVMTVDIKELEKLPKIWRNYQNLSTNVKLSNYVSNSDNFSVISLIEEVAD